MYKNAFFARAGPVRLLFSGGGSSLKLRGLTPNTPLIPIILSLIPVLVALVCSDSAASDILLALAARTAGHQAKQATSLSWRSQLLLQIQLQWQGQLGGIVMGRWQRILLQLCCWMIRLVREVGRHEPQGLLIGEWGAGCD